MNRVFVHGLGAVSPAGWGVAPFRGALEQKQPLPTKVLSRPGWETTLLVRQVPPPPARQTFSTHPRLRRASVIAEYIVAAAVEALGEDAIRVPTNSLRLGIVVCLMAGCVNYTRRFCEEMFHDPALASPLIFPETVFNAPASHLAAYLGSGGISYTLIGDQGVFVQGLALGASWLINDVVDGCIVIGGEEPDWIVADAMRLFERRAVHSAGAGAIYLRRDEPSNSSIGPEVELACVTDSYPFMCNAGRFTAAKNMKTQLCAIRANASNPGSQLLSLGTQGLSRGDAAELLAWADWTDPRISLKEFLGEAFTASAAWQCVAVCDAVQREQFQSGLVSVVGANQQAIGASFVQTAASS